MLHAGAPFRVHMALLFQQGKSIVACSEEQHIEEVRRNDAWGVIFFSFILIVLSTETTYQLKPYFYLVVLSTVINTAIPLVSNYN